MNSKSARVTSDSDHTGASTPRIARSGTPGTKPAGSQS
jgi:hypothetical protein